MKEPIFKATHIVKKFGPTIALNDVDIEIYPGEIRGFIGENGSGKSTMSALMTGIHEATSGYMEYHGKEWKPKSMIDALSKGIGIIVQENGTIANISVAENLFLGELNNFSGENFFESHKVENFSPLFDLKLDGFNDRAKEDYQRASEYKVLLAKQKTGELTEEEKQIFNKNEFKAKALEDIKELKNIYLELDKELKASNELKLQAECERFDAKALELFNDFNAKNDAVNAKYDANEENLPDFLVKRRRNDELNTNKSIYKKACIKLDNESYLRRNWLKNDVKSLKNHFINTVNYIKDVFNTDAYRNFIRYLKKIFFGVFVNSRKLHKYATKALNDIGVNHIITRLPTFFYDLQDRKLVEIAKCLNKKPEIFIVDETTTALSESGREILYKKMKDIRDEGRSVLFISHNLEELMEKCDTLTVLRDGNIVANLDKAKGEFDADAIKKYMIGRELKGDYYRSDWDGSYSDEVVLKMVDGIEGKQLKHVDIELHKGEILGIGGLSDCGMHTLGKALFGNIKMEGGFVYAFDEEGNKHLIKSESGAMKYGIGYLPKNRDVEALALKSNIYDNIAVASLNNIAKVNLFVFKGAERKIVNQQIRDLQIKCNSSQQLVNTLSGGNKQKVSLAKWIGNESEILVLDCPTRGVDIGVKQFIYQLLYQMKKEGKSIIMISEELPELIGMSDRIVIMKDGVITKQFERSQDLTQEEIIEYMI